MFVFLLFYKAISKSLFFSKEALNNDVIKCSLVPTTIAESLVINKERAGARFQRVPANYNQGEFCF